MQLNHRSNGRRRGHSLRRIMVCLSLAALVAAPLSAMAEEGGRSPAAAAGLGAASGLTSLVYAPLKMVYAVGGLTVGGLAYLFSGGDSEVAKVVAVPATVGDYVLTPKHLTGKESIEFFGRHPAYRIDDPEEADNSEIAGLPSGW